MVINLIVAIRADPELLPYCSSLTSRSFNFLNILSYRIPLAIITTIVSLFVYFINKKAKQFEASSGDTHLTIRYQRLENIQATKILTIHTICFWLFYIQNMSAIYVISKVEITELSEFAVMKELSSLAFPIHGNVYVVLALVLSRKLRQKFFSFFVVRRAVKVQSYEVETFTRNSSRMTNIEMEREIYFKTYKEQWG